MDPILDGLNPAQRAAVSSPASILQVLAPPGSGKTKTLTARVAYLLSHHGYRPQDVICCTFTIKASREMRERIAKLIGNEIESKLILGTFHSICRRYLVTYGYLIGLKKGFGIADSNDSLAIIRRIVKSHKLTIQPNVARSRISHHKAHGVGPDEAAAKYNKVVQRVLEQREFVTVYREYEATLAASNLLDYDDLLLRCAELLRRHPQCVSNVQAVLVDEFQDTNHIQYELMNLFASKHRRITVVGDPDQSIYGFRSAEIRNLTRMQELYKDTTIALLEDNYRSSASILSSAQDVIEQDLSRPAKKLQPTHCVGTLPVLRTLPTAADEAEWLVTEIKRCIGLTGKLLNYSDFAVLLRSASLSRQIESAMGKSGVPYRMVGGSRFFDRIEIKLLLDYLRVVSHPGNSDAVSRILNVPSRRIGDESSNWLLRGAEEAKVTLWTFIMDVTKGRRSAKKPLAKTAEQGLCALINLIEDCRRQLADCKDASAPRMLLQLVIDKLHFKDYLKRTYPLDEDSRWANVEELLCQADDTNDSNPTEEQEESLPAIEGLSQEEAHPGEEALSRFLANVALATEVTTQDDAQEGDQTQEKVTISTIHAAKGLEWPVVFVPAVYDGIIPHSRAEDTDEERRLLYVAMTRAQALLYLSFPRRQPRDSAETQLTQFLPTEIIEGRFRSTGPVFGEQVVYGIAEILRRERPSVRDMLKGIDGLRSVRDDLWTADGARHPDDRTRWDESIASVASAGAAFDGPGVKRRRCEAIQGPTSTIFAATSTYSMSNAANFSIPSNYSVGFSSAREVIATHPSPEPGREPVKRPKVAGVPGRKPSSVSQGPISSFFGQGSSRSKAANPSSPLDHLPHSARDTGIVNGIPAQLSTHRLPTQSLQLRRPTLEPSDPNRYTWMAAPRRPGEKAVASHEQENRVCLPTSLRKEEASSSSTVKEASGEIKTLSSSGLVNGVRPVATYHETTVSKVNQFGQSGTTMTRRTLGIRRSMNGWNDRMKRER